MYLDSHTHLNETSLYKNYEKYIDNFLKIWWKKLVNIWVDFERTERALKIQEKYKNICLTSWWFHPTESIFKYKWKNKYEFSKNKIVNWNEYLKLSKIYLENLIKDTKIVAIWECGIDFHYFDFLKDWQTKEEVIKQQEELFILQLDLAKKYNLPVVIHSRDAFYETCEILENYKNLKLYFHCWGYGPKEIEYAQNKFENIWFGFDGNITYKKADNLRESVKKAKLNTILLETDAPYLSPQIVRKEKNQPANVKYVYDYVENLIGKDIKEKVKLNFEKFYNVKIV